MERIDAIIAVDSEKYYTVNVVKDGPGLFTWSWKRGVMQTPSTGQVSGGTMTDVFNKIVGEMLFIGR